jgi:hypothetical protein
MRWLLCFVVVFFMPVFETSARKASGVSQFEFDLQMQRPPQPEGSLTLDRGTLLTPIDPKDTSDPDDRKLYQSVVVCKSIDVYFDERGLSRPFRIEGFCLDPGLPIPPSGVVWHVAGLVEPRIRERCEVEDQAEARQPGKIPLGWSRLDEPCEAEREYCVKRFDAFLKSEHRRGFDYFHDPSRSLCLISPTRKGVVFVYELWCDERSIQRQSR